MTNQHPNQGGSLGGNTNDLLRDDDDGVAEESELFGEVPQHLMNRKGGSRDTFGTPTNPFETFEGSTDTSDHADINDDPFADSAPPAKGGFFAKAPKKQKTPKAAKTRKGGGGSTAQQNTPAKERSGAMGALTGFFAGPPTDKTGTTTGGKGKPKRGKGQTRKGLSYTRRNGFQNLVLGLLTLSTVLSLLALIIAVGKPSKGSIQESVDKAVTEAGQGFPKGSAVQFAGQVLRVWGTWDSENATAHQTYMAPFLTAGMDPQAGWNSRGKQSVQYAVMNPDPVVIDKNRALVSGTYQIQDGTWRCVTIPVYAYHATGTTGASQWAFTLSANPAPTPCAPRTGAASVENYNLGKKYTEDQAANQVLQDSFFPGFMSAWGASNVDGLNQYTVPGVTLTGLGGAVESTPQPAISDVHLLIEGETPQQDTVYNAVVTVGWTVAGSDSGMSATYVVPMKKTGDRWYAAGEPQTVSQAAMSQGGAPGAINQPGADATPGGYATSDATPSSSPATVNPGTSAPASPSSSPSASSSAPAASSSSGAARPSSPSSSAPSPSSSSSATSAPSPTSSG